MKRLVVIFFAFCITYSCRGQQTSEREERINSHCLDYIEWRITTYADSLNFWKKGDALPAFLFDEKFDLKHIFDNTCFKEANPFSFRRFIIDRIYSIEALKSIAETQDSRLDNLFTPTDAQLNGEGLVLKDFYKKFPYRTHSTRSLVQKRLKYLVEKTKK